VLVSRAIHRHFVDTTDTYFEGGRLTLEELPTNEDGTTDLAALAEALADADRPVAGVLLGQPNCFGILEPMAEAARLAHDAGALFVAVVEPVSLAVLAPPAEYGADIAVGEGQPLGIALGYGGPYLGLLAARAELVRQVPGRLVGRTTDLDGRRAYVMTLRAREQDIRRDKAASNICTNQALCALAATVYLATLGPHGLRDVAALGAARARDLELALAEAGAPRLHSGPYLNEFAVRVPDARRVHAALLERDVLAGLPLAEWYPTDPAVADALLVCATEVTTAADITRFADALREVLA
jgi:glycine dehydrogenase subunit 1